ncbi:MAG TPA: hypothetical protein VF546_23445 [Pyrinomonadaceae bacterium]|jgi:hypothetical protein
MRRLLAIFVLTGALLCGGWGHVWAAGTCAHAATETAAAAAGETPDSHAQTHDCCRAKLAHTQRAAAHEAHAPAQTPTCEHALAEEDATDTADSSAAQASVEASESGPLCGHCLGRSAPAPRLLPAAQGAQATQRAMVAPALCALRLALPVVNRVAVFAPSQHAPPTRARRHLLLNILLI